MSSKTDEAARTRLLRRALYALVLGVAAALRFANLGFSPSTPWARPDEEIFAAVALGLFTDPNPHVGHTGWPELFFWATHGVQRLLAARLALEFGAVPHLGCLFVLDPARLIVPARAMSACFGVATVALVMRLGFLAAPRLASPGERHAIALGAGWLYAVNVLAMRDAHFAVSDTALVFFFVGMLVAVAQGLDRGRPVDFLVAGVALGLAISTKWTGLTFAVVPVLALGVKVARHGLSFWPFAPEERPAWRSGAALMLGLAGAVGAFVLTSPSVLDEPGQYWEGLFSHQMRYDPNNYQAFSFRAHATPTPGFVQHAIISFPFAWGWPLVVVSALACLHGLWRGARWREAMPALLATFALLFWVAVVGRTTMNFARYSLPAHPPLAALSAITIHALARWLERAALRVPALAVRFAHGALAPSAVAFVAILAALSAEPTVRSVDYVRVLGLNDTRELARAWLLENAPEARLDTLGGYGRLYAVESRLVARCEALLPPALHRPVPRLDFPADQSVQTNESRASWRPTASAALYPVLFRGSPPPLRSPFVVDSRPYLPCGQETVRYDGTDPPERCYRERARFGPGELPCDAVFDEQDHFYVPLWGYAGLRNQGPTVRIFENVCSTPRSGLERMRDE